MKYRRLETIIPMTAGIFQQIKDNGYNAPWDSMIDASTLDLEYIGNRSGMKPISPLVFKMLESDTLSAAKIE